MSSIDYSRRTIDSPLVDFIVGEEDNTFSLHREAIASISPAFKAMIDATRFRPIEWPDVQVDTFASFAQFAYTGNYSLAGDGSDGESTITITGAERKDEHVDVRTICYSASFLGNARLYALAAQYGAESLQKLALDNIGHVLDYFTDYTDIHMGPRDSLADLAEFAFSNHDYSAERADGLLGLVLRYTLDDTYWDGWLAGYARGLKKKKSVCEELSGASIERDLMI